MTCDLYKFFVHIAYGRGSVLRRGDEIPRGGTTLGFSSPLTMHCYALAAKGIGREEGDGNAQRGRSVIYDCRVITCRPIILIIISVVMECYYERILLECHAV